jgi:hypothetical protein
MNVTQDMSVWGLVSHASLFVQLVMLGLLLASLLSWWYIFRKAFALRQAKADTEAFEKDFWSGGDLNGLYQAAAAAKHRGGSLERIFEASKESYYETLEASSQGWHEAAHTSAPWLDYFWGALLLAYKEFEERVGTIERGRGAKGDRVRSEILKRQQPFSISEIEAACPGVSRDMVRVVLRALKAEGVIAPSMSAKLPEPPKPACTFQKSPPPM